MGVFVHILSSRSCKKMYKVYFLGGIGEIGRNMTVLETATGLYVIDCGSGLCEGNTVYPDMSCLQQKADEIKALIITHGHDDHIGGIGVFNARFPRVPIYSSPFTLELIKKRFKLSRLTPLISKLAGQQFDVGDATFEFIHVNHSIPQAYAVYIKTKEEKLLFSGDFKIDLLNSDEPPTNLKRIRQIGEAGLDALFIETTNAAKPGHSRSTEIVKHGLDDIFRTYSNERLVFSLFSSNVQRINIILDLALRYNRKVFFYGKSMQDVISVARKLNLLHDIPFLIEDINDVYMYPDNEVVIVTTGGQGERKSGLYKMCSNYNAPTILGTNDVVVFSASIIPGNEQAIGSLKSKLKENGCLCIDNTSHITHCSGHGNISDLLMFISAANPECIIPIHGYFRFMTILKRKILSHGKIKAKYKAPSEDNHSFESTSLSSRHNLLLFNKVTNQLIDKQIFHLLTTNIVQIAALHESACAPLATNKVVQNRSAQQVKNLANDDVMQLMLNKTNGLQPAKSNKADLSETDKKLYEEPDNQTLSRTNGKVQKCTMTAPTKPVKQEKNIIKDNVMEIMLNRKNIVLPPSKENTAFTDADSVPDKQSKEETLSDLKIDQPTINQNGKRFEKEDVMEIMLNRQNVALPSNKEDTALTSPDRTLDKQTKTETLSNLKTNRTTISKNGKELAKDNIMEFLLNSDASADVKAPAKCVGGYNYYRYSSQELYDSNSEFDDFFEIIDDDKR